MNHRTQTLLLRLAKPLLHAHLELYRRELATAPFPLDEPERTVPGDDPDRLAFVGSIAVSGYGVLHHGMKTSSRTAQLLSAVRGRGCEWTEVTTPTMTASAAAELSAIAPVGTDAVVLLLGITDVLLVTSPGEWGCALERLIARVRGEVGDDVAVAIAAIPPMAEFRPIPPVAARLLTKQIDGLNAVSQELATRTRGVAYVAFPKWEVGELFIQEVFSWATMHRMWAKAITPAVADLLAVREVEGAACVAAVDASTTAESAALSA